MRERATWSMGEGRFGKDKHIRESEQHMRERITQRARN